MYKCTMKRSFCNLSMCVYSPLSAVFEVNFCLLIYLDCFFLCFWMSNLSNLLCVIALNILHIHKPKRGVHGVNLLCSQDSWWEIEGVSGNMPPPWRISPWKKAPFFFFFFFFILSIFTKKFKSFDVNFNFVASNLIFFGT